MQVKFGAINVLNPQAPDYVTVGSKIRDTSNGRELELTVCRKDDLISRVLGSPRYVIEGTPLKVSSPDPQMDAMAEWHLGIVLGNYDVHKYTLPLDSEEGVIQMFDKIG